MILDKDVPEWYHPGRAASINLGKSLLGYFGELHPKYTENYGMRISCFELIHNNLPQKNKKKFNNQFAQILFEIFYKLFQGQIFFHQ